MGKVLSASRPSTCACRGCFAGEDDRKEKAKHHFNLEKKQHESVATHTETSGEAVLVPDNVEMTASGEAVADNAEMTPYRDDIHIEGLLGIDSKTAELLACMDPIAVSTIHGVDQHPIMPSDTNADVPLSEPAPIIVAPEIAQRASVEYSRTVSTSTPIDIIPDDKEVQNSTELPLEEESVAICDMEKNVSSIRVKQLSEILDPVALRKVLEEQYAEEESEEDDDEEEDDESEEMDPAELAEIQRRKSESINIQNKNNTLPLFQSQLCRDDSVGKWEKGDIEALRADMEHQLSELNSLKKDTLIPQEKEPQQPSTKPKSYVIKVSGATKDDDELEVSEDEEQEANPKSPEHPENSHLFRNQSAYKWDPNALKQTKEEMEKEMMHLIMDGSK